MYWKLGYQSFLRRLTLHILLLLQLACAVFLLNVMCAGVNGRSELYNPLKPYLTAKGVYFGKHNGYPVTEEEIRRTLTSVDEVISVREAVFRSNDIDWRIVVYDDSLAKRLSPEMEEGVWFTHAPKEEGIVNVVALQNNSDYKVGDIIEGTSMFPKEGTSGNTEMKFRITGIMKTGEYYPTFQQGGIAESVRDLYAEHTNLNPSGIPMLFSSASFLENDVVLTPGMQVLVTFHDDISKEDYDANLETLGSIGYYTTNEEMNAKCLKYINAEVKVLMPIIFCLLLVTAVGLLSSGAISTLRQLKTYGIYFICGCRWKDCIKIAMANTLIILAGSVLVAACALAISYSTGWMASASLILGWNNLLYTALLLAFTFAVSVIVPFVLLHKRTPVDILRNDD